MNTEDRKLTFKQQQDLNYIRDSAMRTACASLTTAELKCLNPNLLKTAPKMYQALKAVKNAVEQELRITDSTFGYDIFIREKDWKRMYEGAINEVLAEAEEIL